MSIADCWAPMPESSVMIICNEVQACRVVYVEQSPEQPLPIPEMEDMVELVHQLQLLLQPHQDMVDQQTVELVEDHRRQEVGRVDVVHVDRELQDPPVDQDKMDPMDMMDNQVEMDNQEVMQHQDQVPEQENNVKSVQQPHQDHQEDQDQRDHQDNQDNQESHHNQVDHHQLDHPAHQDHLDNQDNQEEKVNQVDQEQLAKCPALQAHQAQLDHPVKQEEMDNPVDKAVHPQDHQVHPEMLEHQDHQDKLDNQEDQDKMDQQDREVDVIIVHHHEQHLDIKHIILIMMAMWTHEYKQQIIQMTMFPYLNY